MAPWNTTQACAQRTARSRPTSCQHVLAVEQDLAGDGRGLRQQAQHGGGQRGLPAAGLPGDAQRAAGVDGEVHPAHGRDVAVARRGR